MSDRAERIAAKKLGMTPQQVRATVKEYREAAEDLYDEPEWRSLSHMSGRDFAIAQYVCDGSRVTLQIDSDRDKRNDQWREIKTYVLDGKGYETFGEAREVELGGKPDMTNVVRIS